MVMMTFGTAIFFLFRFATQRTFARATMMENSARRSRLLSSYIWAAMIAAMAPSTARAEEGMIESQPSQVVVAPTAVMSATSCCNGSCPNYNGSCGQRCVDRNGQGCKEEWESKHGIGPCPDADCQCWQCPHEEPFCSGGPGQYAGPARSLRLDNYRLRPGDSVQFLYLLTALKSEGAYRLAVGDELLIESEADEEIKRGTLTKGIVIQPDGTITLRLIGQIHAAGQTVEQLRKMIEEKYTEFYDEPAIDVTPINTGSSATQVRNAVTGVGGFTSQQVTQTVTPSGEIRLPKIGSVMAQGLSLDELKQEINLRYDSSVGGLEVEPSLVSQAPHNIFVLGEVNNPGRFELNNTPTTVLGAVAMAGSYRPGANLRQVVIFRRGENWELLSTMVDVRAAALGREAHPTDEIWVRDGDVIILPSTPIKLFDNFVRQVFTEGIYGVVPVNASYNFGSSFN
jgi:polysaccharide biosynthesis/export protein